MSCVIFTMAMFLYPLWILFVGALAVLLADLNRKNGIIPSLLSFFTVASSALVLVPYLFFGQPRVVAGPGDIFLFTLDHVSKGYALCLSIIGVGYVLQLAGRGIPEAGRRKERASVLFILGLAMGAVFSSNLLTVVFFTEAAYLFCFAAAKKRLPDVYLSAVHDRMFFIPTVVIVFVLIFQGITGGNGPLSVVLIPELSCFFIVFYVLMRLFFFPFFLSSDTMAGTFREPFPSCLAVFASFAGVAATVKVLAIGPGVSFVIFLISSMAAGIYSVVAYRQKDLERLAFCIFFVVTSCVTAAAGLHALMPVKTGREIFFMICNHFTSAAAVIFTAAMLQKRAGRTVMVSFVIFLLAFVGLLPSAGFAGKIGFYREAFREGGNVAVAAFFPVFFSFLPVFFYVRWFAEIKRGSKVTDMAINAGQRAFLGMLLANLYLPFLYFIK